MRGLLVTATDTGVGKTILSTALLAAMVAAGEQVCAHKPVVTGLDEPADMWLPDHELLASAVGMTPEDVAPLRYGPAVSPHLAAQLAGERIDQADLVTHARAVGDDEAALIVEGVGGLLAPLAEDYTVRDFAVALGLPLLIAARPGLGTINHTLLTLQAARGGGTRGARGRAHPVAGATVAARALQPRDDRTDGRHRGRGTQPCPEPEPGRL